MKSMNQRVPASDEYLFPVVDAAIETVACIYVDASRYLELSASLSSSLSLSLDSQHTNLTESLEQ